MSVGMSIGGELLGQMTGIWSMFVKQTKQFSNLGELVYTLTSSG